MILILASLLISAQTKLYNSGFAPLDTASAVVPLMEFRQVIIGLEERKSLKLEIKACQDLVDAQREQTRAIDQALASCLVASDKYRAALNIADQNRKELVVSTPRAPIFGFWSGAATGALLSMLLSLLAVAAVR